MWQGYQRKRVLRASTIHGLAGMAAIMASTYKAYLGEGLGPLSWIQRFKIPHPGRVRPPPRNAAVAGVCGCACMQDTCSVRLGSVAG